MISVAEWGLYGMGCKDKPKVATEEGKEKAGIIVFEPSKVNSKVSAGFVDIIEPVEKVSVNSLIHTGGWAQDPYKKFLLRESLSYQMENNYLFLLR